MATRSRIGLKLSDGSILSAYHHYDGYPQWLGVHLDKYFRSDEKASELIDGGDMSNCWSNEFWDTRSLMKTVVLPDGREQKTFVRDQNGEIVRDRVKSEFGPLYYSERGEDTPPRHDDDLFDFLSNGEEYAYVWEGGCWVCYDLHGDEPEIVEIPQVL